MNRISRRVAFVLLLAAHAVAEAQTAPTQHGYGAMIREVSAQYAEPTMALSRDGRWLSYGSADGAVRVMRTDQQSAEVTVPLEQGARCGGPRHVGMVGWVNPVPIGPAQTAAAIGQVYSPGNATVRSRLGSIRL